MPAQITRAQLLAKQGKLDEARKLLAEPADAPIRATRRCSRARTPRMLFDAKRYPEAEARLAKPRPHFPDDPDITYDYAMAAEKNGHYDIMEAQLRKLIETQPDNPQAYNALGYSLVDRGLRLRRSREADREGRRRLRRTTRSSWTASAGRNIGWAITTEAAKHPEARPTTCSRTPKLARISAKC